MNTRTERIGTRIGPIEVQNGYPSQSAAKALYDELDFQRASQAYLWALPAVGFTVCTSLTCARSARRTAMSCCTRRSRTRPAC